MAMLRQLSPDRGLRSALKALMTDDVELFILRWRLEIRIDCFKVFLRGPAVPAGSPLLRSRSCVLHTASDSSTKCNSCSACVRSISSRNHARCAFVAAAKSSTTEILFDKRTQMCGVSAFFSRVYRFTNDGMSVISPGNKAVTKSSCTSKTAFSRSANSLASVDLPAAIFPQRKINFAEPAIWPHIIALVTRAVDEIAL